MVGHLSRLFSGTCSVVRATTCKQSRRLANWGGQPDLYPNQASAVSFNAYPAIRLPLPSVRIGSLLKSSWSAPQITRGIRMHVKMCYAIPPCAPKTRRAKESPPGSIAFFLTLFFFAQNWVFMAVVDVGVG